MYCWFKNLNVLNISLRCQSEEENSYAKLAVNSVELVKIVPFINMENKTYFALFNAVQFLLQNKLCIISASS
jgi:hypothetical protein